MADQSVSFRQLVEFAAGELDNEDRNRIDRIVAASSSLQRDLDGIRRVLETMQTDDTVEAPADLIERTIALFARRQPAAAPVWQERAACLLSRLVFDSRHQTALAGFRGGSERYHLAYHSELASVDVQIAPEEDAPASGSFRVRGQVTPAEGAQAQGVRLLESGSELIVAETSADEHGWFRLSTRGGMYDLKIALAQDTILVPDLHIG